MLRSHASDLRVVVLEGDDSTPEETYAGGEPDRRVAAGAADLEHLARGLRRDERMEELPRRRRDLPRALRGRQAALALLGVLRLEPREHGAHPFVQHQSGTSTFTHPSSTRTANVATGSNAGSVSGRPVAMSKREPWRGQIAMHSSGSHSPFAERPVVVRAAVLERVVGAVAVVDADPDEPGVDDPDVARRELLDRADVDDHGCPVR